MARRAPKKSDAIFAPGLPVEVESGAWWRLCVSTLGAVSLRAGRSFRAVEEPVRHAPALAFIATLRLPTWIVLFLVALIEWWQQPAGTEQAIDTTAATQLLGLQLGQVLSVWSLFMVPLRIPVLYFLCGLVGHMIMALTGGAHRSIGASMRALGFAFAPMWGVVALLELAAARSWITPEQWLAVFGVSAVLSWGLGAIALGRTHGTTILRGVFVALLPLLVFCVDAYGAALFELAWDPMVGPPAPPAYLLPPP